jgi:hypothetical protein
MPSITTEARYGLIGALVGAFIGGVGSFSGALLTYKQQTDTHTEDVKRAAYVDFLSDAVTFRETLFDLKDAVDNKDQPAYSDALSTSRIAASNLSTAGATIGILGDADLTVSVREVTQILLFVRPRKLESYDRARGQNAINAAPAAFIAFTDAAKRSLHD